MENQPYQKLNVNRQYLDQMANGQIGWKNKSQLFVVYPLNLKADWK